MGDVGNQIYHSFTEEDKIDKEIPVTITNDISRQDIELPEPASKRIDWAKGPTYYNKIRSTLRPAYYPGKTETSFEPIKRNYEYGNSFIDKPMPTSGYNTLRGYTSPPNYDANRQVKPNIVYNLTIIY